MPALNKASWLGWALTWLLTIKTAQAFIVTPFLQPSFLFGWDNRPFPVPVSEQCETLQITWGRQAQTGPNPTAPYYLQIYTSNFIQPFVVPAGDGLSFNYTVPFAPGTLYQICMFDKFGNTGGCQNTYTIIPASTPPTCQNVTFVPQLEVAATVDTGPMSQYGFIDQCTDISLQPMSGTPPFTLTVAPALHPPYNITSFDMKPINWTLSLNWAMPFFISLSDSTGSMWSNGPLHAGGGGTMACLAGNITASRNVRVPVAVGVSFLSLFFGIALGLAGFYFSLKRRARNFVQLQDSPALENQINPFQTSPSTDEENLVSSQRQVYVVHHDDRGVPPVTIIHSEQTEIVELPPRYPAYTKAESKALSREIGLERSFSAASSNYSSPSVSSPSVSSPSVSSESEAAPEHRESAHYDPRGPLRLHQPRRPISLLGKSSLLSGSS